MPQEKPLCRFCLDGRNTRRNPLLQPCACRGSLAFVHMKCLNRWRNTNLERNGSLCHLCMTDYNLPEPINLERIPEGDTHLLSLVKHPFLISFVGHYVWIFHASFGEKDQVDFLKFYCLYQILIQMLYLGLFLFNFQVTNKRLYIQGWGQQKRYFYFLIHATLVLLLQNGIWMSGLTIDIFLGVYWRTHIQILKEVNDQVLREYVVHGFPLEDEQPDGEG